jgi:hypothetical protein
MTDNKRLELAPYSLDGLLDDDSLKEHELRIRAAPLHLAHAIEKLEQRWSERPRFKTRDEVNAYLDQWQTAFEKVRKWIDVWFYRETLNKEFDIEDGFGSSWKDEYTLGLWGILIWIVLFIPIGLTVSEWLSNPMTLGQGFRLLGWTFLKAVGFVIGAFVLYLLGFMTYVFFAKKSLRKKGVAPTIAMRLAINRYEIFRSRIERSKEEIFDDVQFEKSLKQEADKLNIEHSFIERRAYRGLMERLTVIENEAKIAKDTAMSVEEQNRRTDAVKTKYAQELIELQRRIKAESDQGLIAKLGQVEILLTKGFA